MKLLVLHDSVTLRKEHMAPTKPVRFLHGNIFCKVWKKRPAGLSEAFWWCFFSGFVCVGWEYWGLQLATCFQNFQNVRHQLQKPDQGNRGGESCKGCLRAGKGGDLIVVGSARLYLFDCIIYTVYVYIYIYTLGSRGSVGFPYQVDQGCDAGTASLMRPLRHYLCGSRCVPGRKRGGR